MGLDCTAYSNLKARPDIDVAKAMEEEGDVIFAFAYPGFERSTRGLINHDVVSHHLLSGGGEIAAGVYEMTPATQQHDWRAGSYGGYSQFREEIAQMLGFQNWSQYMATDDESQPFWELLNFADNEGCIGPEAAKDLLEDFKSWANTWQVANANDEWNLEKWADWTLALELASQDGLIEFH